MKIGAVIIGCNEEKDLREALRSAPDPKVYVDSGSTGSSLQIAKEEGVHAISLDPSRLFSAARGRNKGAQYLLENHPDLEAIQFLDGDCVLCPLWCEKGAEVLRVDQKLAAVFGVLKEKNRQGSIYNVLAEMEWNTKVGRVEHFAGIVLIRAAIFQEVGFYNPLVVAGEEPEFSMRITQQGWEICKIAEIMGFHDADIMSFSQWYKRAYRSGFSMAHRHDLHSTDCARENKSAIFWGGIVPFVFVLALFFSPLMAAVLFCAYPLLFIKIARGRRRSHSEPLKECILYGFFTTLAKVPEFLGIVAFHWHNKNWC